MPKKFIITVGSIDKEVFPLNKEIIYDFDQNDGNIFYNKKLGSTLKFYNEKAKGIDDFDFFYSYEKDQNLRCETFYIKIFQICEGVDVLEWEGKFSLNDGEWDIDRCIFKVKPIPDTIYDCIKGQKKNERNFLQLTNVITTTVHLSYNYEYAYCIGVGAPLGGLCTKPGPNPTTWSLLHTEGGFQHGSYNNSGLCGNSSINVTIYYREFIVTNCVGGSPVPPPGAGWVLEQNDCGLNNLSKWVRSPIAGPIFGINPAIGYGYNDANTPDQLPPYPKYKSILITNQPNTPDIEGYTIAQTSSLSGTGSDWTFEVPCNPNSTYVWGTGAFTGITFNPTFGQGTCKVRGYFFGASFGTCNVQVTETHGNGWVSQKTFVVNVQNFNSTNNISSQIVGPSKVCPNQTQIKYRIPELPIPTDPAVTLTNPNWTVTGGASIISGNGTKEITVNAGTNNFTVSFTWNISSSSGGTQTFNGSLNVTITKVPYTEDIYGITELYPNENGITWRTHNRPGSIYDWQIDAITFSGDGTNTVTQTSGSTSSFCIKLKEEINCGCSWTKIIPGGINGITPPVYLCFNETSVNVTYDRNRLFSEVCEDVIMNMDCGINGLVSDFFQWNPVGDTPGFVFGINYVTGLANKLKYITIAQKSDIIEPTSSNPATKAPITFERIEKIWLEVFNAYWFIDSMGRMRVEHESYFQRVIAFNANSGNHAKFNKSKNKFSYDKTEMPKYENFKWQESLFTDFVGAKIYYDSICVNQDIDTNESQRGVEFVTTDLNYIFLYPDDIDPFNYVLICNQFDGTNYSVDFEDGEITGSSIANGHLSWANLHKNYHRHGRILSKGYMNNILTNFFSYKRTKEQKEIIIEICCGDNFDPLLQKIQTELGDGIMSDGQFNSTTGIFKMTLKHN